MLNFHRPGLTAMHQTTPHTRPKSQSLQLAQKLRTTTEEAKNATYKRRVHPVASDLTASWTVSCFQCIPVVMTVPISNNAQHATSKPELN